MVNRPSKPCNLTEPPGVPCPRCRSPIRLTIAKLLSGTPVFCSECGLQLLLDAGASAEGLAAVRKLERSMKDLEEQK
jgi:hypothetical protein